MLSGGVGGARLARGLAAVVPAAQTSVIVNVGDDENLYGVRVSADLDTVLYTLAGIEGPHGWGISGDTFTVMGHLAARGVDTTFRLGDRDLATCLIRTAALASGEALSAVTATLAASFGIGLTLLPATDDPVATRVGTDDGWLSFQEYFVRRSHQDDVRSLDFGADASTPGPGVIDAIEAADLVIIAPSNPPLSIWPILAVPGIGPAMAAARTRVPVVAVSPLFGGRALKGPADRVMRSLGLPDGNAGVAAAYAGLVSHLVVDEGDAADATALGRNGLTVLAMDTHVGDADAAARFARRLIAEVAP